MGSAHGTCLGDLTLIRLQMRSKCTGNFKKNAAKGTPRRCQAAAMPLTAGYWPVSASGPFLNYTQSGHWPGRSTTCSLPVWRIAGARLRNIDLSYHGEEIG
jgi:hypothetical protein